ncbi:hypothetical protein P5G65_16440 [Paenibacillus chondroitinus]|uniref:Uncharacterized protein n=1 Tax=Paenibacillus chondroitinus TaxID=59842 RepID=A0ABU6DCM9_9BACL|nr:MULTISPECIES: hypothetical protein [Paenibacillus]MCY9659889.1 hypothetical protein [Paenibacillus anseongense]MEB4795493.1 hypothetical protein [Paenibacillus chondroitinus]
MRQNQFSLQIRDNHKRVAIVGRDVYELKELPISDKNQEITAGMLLEAYSIARKGRGVGAIYDVSN